MQYVMDNRVGNTDGLGAAFGILAACGESDSVEEAVCRQLRCVVLRGLGCGSWVAGVSGGQHHLPRIQDAPLHEPLPSYM